MLFGTMLGIDQLARQLWSYMRNLRGLRLVRLGRFVSSSDQFGIGFGFSSLEADRRLITLIGKWCADNDFPEAHHNKL